VAGVSGMEDRQRQLVAQPMRLALNGGSLRVVTEQASLDSVALVLLFVLLQTFCKQPLSTRSSTLLCTLQTASWVQELETEASESWRHLPLYFCEVRHPIA